MNDSIGIFIADDNKLALDALKLSIPWGNDGMTLVGTAENGPDAIKGIKASNPDIILMDIQMPGCDGLKVIEECEDKDNPRIYILISAYDNFEFAKKGIELGVKDYLLKPVDDAELLKTLKKNVAKVHEIKGRIRLYNQSREQYIEKVKESEEERSKRILLNVLNGNTGEVQFLEDYMNKDSHCCGYELMLICKDELDNNEQNKDISKFVEYERKCLDTISGTRDKKYISVWLKEGIVVLMGFKGLNLKREYDIYAFGFASQLNVLNVKDDHNIFIGISNFFEHCIDIPKALKQASFACESRFFMENKNVIHYGSMESKSVSNEYMLSVRLQELYKAFDKPELFMKSLEEYIDLICEYGNNDVDYIRNIFMHIAIMLSTVAKGKFPSDENIKSIEKIMSEVKVNTSLNSLTDWIINYAGYITELLDNKDLMPASSQTRKALDYINCHYMEHLSLKEVADACMVSESYMCRLLKSDTGETFVNILNKVRIQKAIELLKEGEMKVYEIAEVVGFSNYAYFYQMFKKVTGATPTNY